MAHPRHEFVHDDIANGPVSGPLVERSEVVVHFAAETHVDRSIQSAGAFIRTDVEGTFVLLEAARRAPRLRRFIQISTDEVYGSVPDGRQRRDRRAEAAEPVRRQQGRRGSPGLQLLGHLRRARGDHARVEQLRAVPVPGEGDPALRDQRDRRQAGAALRRRPQRARLAARGRPLPGRRPADRQGRARRGVQRRRRQRHHERRADAPHPRRRWASRAR